MCPGISWRRVVANDLSYLLLIGDTVLLEQVVGVGLSRRIRVGLVEERLNAEQKLLDGNGGFPGFVLVEDGQTHGAGWVDVWVEEWGDEFA